MRAKPGIDAVDVEGVSAEGERTDVVVLNEFEQANGAIAGEIVNGASFQPVLLGVDGEGHRFDDRLVEAVGGVGVGGRVGRGLGGASVGGGADGGGKELSAAAPAPVAADLAEERGEEMAGDEAGVGDDEESGGGDHDHGDERGAEIDGRRRVVRNGEQVGERRLSGWLIGRWRWRWRWRPLKLRWMSGADH